MYAPWNTRQQEGQNVNEQILQPLRANPWERKGESTQGNVRTVGKDTGQEEHERSV